MPSPFTRGQADALAKNVHRLAEAAQTCVDTVDIRDVEEFDKLDGMVRNKIERIAPGRSVVLVHSLMREVAGPEGVAILEEARRRAASLRGRFETTSRPSAGGGRVR